jgi:hypothetical protein
MQHLTMNHFHRLCHFARAQYTVCSKVNLGWLQILKYFGILIQFSKEKCIRLFLSAETFLGRGKMWAFALHTDVTCTYMYGAMSTCTHCAVCRAGWRETQKNGTKFSCRCSPSRFEYLQCFHLVRFVFTYLFCLCHPFMWTWETYSPLRIVPHLLIGEVSMFQLDFNSLYGD